MQPFTQVASVAIPLDVPNIDTDQIIPARFMTRPRKDGYGDFLLHDVRRDEAGAKLPDHPLNDPAFKDAAVLVAARNFGTGSSREAAVYALWDAGIRCVIATSFGDIFASNAVKNGLLPARIGEEDQVRLVRDLKAAPGVVVTVHLAQQEILWGDEAIAFDIAEGAKHQLLNGWDDIDLTLQHAASIDSWAAADRSRRPWAVPVPPQPDETGGLP